MSKIQTSLRLDEEKLKEAKKILSELGMNFTEAVNIFTSMVVAKHGLPFEVRIPNKETESVMKDIRAGKNSEEVSLDELKDELGHAEAS
jgi:DNA-damage-inducible protein J